jgi:hypothetical protein
MSKLKEYKRRIRVCLHRTTTKENIVIWTKYYSKLENALMKAPVSVVFFAQPGDVLEITSSNFDYLIATIKFKVGKTSIANMETMYHIGAEEEKLLAQRY